LAKSNSQPRSQENVSQFCAWIHLLKCPKVIFSSDLGIRKYDLYYWDVTPYTLKIKLSNENFGREKKKT